MERLKDHAWDDAIVLALTVITVGAVVGLVIPCLP